MAQPRTEIDFKFKHLSAVRLWWCYPSVCGCSANREEKDCLPK